MKKLYLIISIFFSLISFSKLKVGITMLPYYSYVANIVDDKMEVVPVIPEGANVHSYTPSVEDIKKLTEVDIVVVNGIGHDDFINKMIEVAKITNPNMIVINANEKSNLIYTQGQKFRGEKNPHTFISITQSIQQVDHIAQSLAKIDPKNSKEYIKNANEYNNKLRKMKYDALNRVKGKLHNLDVATTHAGYDYLLLEFGITVAVVIEPAHGQNPNANDVKKAIDKIRDNNIKILFDEIVTNNKNAQMIKKETGVYIANLDHLTNGKYTKDAFESLMQKNLDTIVKAILSTN